MTSYQPVQVWPELAPSVVAIQVQDTDGADVAATQIMPTPFPVLGFQFRGRLAVDSAGQQRLLERSGVTVLQADARTFVPQADTRSVLVTLQPSAAYTLLGWPMHELADQHLGLADFLGPTWVHEVEAQLAEARSTAERGAVVQRHLLMRFTASDAAPHPVVVEAVRRVLGAGGLLRIRPLADELGVSERQLERLFREQVGAGPKRFASLVQFDWAWRRASSGLSLSALASEAGYSDQAHLTRTFVQRNGVPPAQLLAQAARIATL